ncbi:MAG: OmpA family protein [Gammaproteobacteria bacterium]|nr:OmpA family protein [Gammaproteobacteria bacterium]
MNKINRALPGIFSLAAVLVGCASTAEQTATHNPTEGYATNSTGEILRSGYNECVRSGSWTESTAAAECQPVVAAQEPSTTESNQAAETAAAGAEAQPQGEALPAAEPKQTYVGADAYFEFGQATLTSGATRGLDTVAEHARSAENVNVRVVGYADQIGSDDYNMALSRRRAEAVRTYLVEHGVSENAIEVEARGETDPIVSCDGHQGTALVNCLRVNRRSEVQFSALEPVER